MEERKSEAEKVRNKIATRAGRKDSLSSIHKSAITDHVADNNHVIGCDDAKVLYGTKEDKYNIWIREAIEIRKRRGKAMNSETIIFLNTTQRNECFVRWICM